MSFFEESQGQRPQTCICSTVPTAKQELSPCFLGQISALFTNRQQGSRNLKEKLSWVPSVTHSSPPFTLFLDLLQEQVLHGRLLGDVGRDLTLAVHSSHVGPVADQVPAAGTPGPPRHTSACLQSSALKDLPSSCRCNNQMRILF